MSTIDSTAVFTSSPGSSFHIVFIARLSNDLVAGLNNALYTGISVTASDTPTTPAPSTEGPTACLCSLICRYLFPKLVAPNNGKAAVPASSSGVDPAKDCAIPATYFFAALSPTAGVQYSCVVFAMSVIVSEGSKPVNSIPA